VAEWQNQAEQNPAVSHREIFKGEEFI